ncbi:UDP-glycosyltransferase UGT5-like [Anthonomus grandis grandis]|uniref:UDP-glycosyltransferase UGT5-like n=1 Tax=Anthonomus grandis grandis TaxID=2921223 RepID=UPI002166031B|nr:UDP-glycosyltransferase UGT5-like [Anthonomus grandis grandis]
MKLFVPILCIVLIHNASAARILVLLPHIYLSHFKATSTLVTELNARGHEITLVSPYPNVINTYYNITEIDIRDVIEPIAAFTTKTLSRTISSSHSSYFWSHLQYTSQIGYQYAKQIFENINFQRLIHSNATFDLVLLEDVGADALTILAHICKCPLVTLLSEPVSQFYKIYLTDNIFWKQLNEIQNSHIFIMTEIYREFITIPYQNQLMKEIIPVAPDLRNILFTTNLVLLPSYTTIGNLMPKYLNVKQIGGYHIDETIALPKKNIDLFYNKGGIVISSNLPDLAKEALKKFITNNKISEYFIFTPDVAEVIAYRNVKLLITDGDVYDISSAIFHHIPVISISVNRWQKRFLVDILAEMGCVSIVSIDELESAIFSEVLNEVLLSNGTSFQQQLQLASIVLNTHPIWPRHEAVFWIEHVLELQGASYLIPRHLRWTNKNHLILLIIVLTIIDIVLLIIFYWIFRHLFIMPLLFFGRTLRQKLKNRKQKANTPYIKL